MTRAAIYARYSSDLQSEASIEDQVNSCQRLIKDKGWQLAQTYTDHAMSGATALRAGYQALMADARDGKFEVVVTEGLDRLSRDQETIAGLFKQLAFAGIAIFTCSEGEISELHVGLKGTMNALFLKDLAIKTHRGLEGRVRQGKSAGGRAYGYDIVRARDDRGEEIHGERSINPQQATVIRRIFDSFASGKSPRAIARELNAEAIPGPRGRNWRDGTIRGHALRRTGILRNDLYAGRLIWNRQRFIRDPVSGKRVARQNPREQWLVEDVPHLRIVDADLWQKVQQRLEGVRQSPRSKKIRKSEFWKNRRPQHLLTGLVHCAECGMAMAAVGRDYLACSAARSGAGCTNSKGIKRSLIEQAVLEGLKTRLMEPDLVEEFVRAFQEEVNRQCAQDEILHHQTRQELKKVSGKIDGLHDAIADGLRTEGLKAKLEGLEGRQKELQDKLTAAPPPKPRLHPGLAQLYRSKVAHLHAALSDREGRTEAAEILRGLVDQINVCRDSHGIRIELIGDIVKLISLPEGSDVPASFESSVKVVAGAGFEPATFRL